MSDDSSRKVSSVNGTAETVAAKVTKTAPKAVTAEKNKSMAVNVLVLGVYTFALYLLSVYTGVNRQFIYIALSVIVIAVIVAIILHRLKSGADRLLYTFMFMFILLGVLIQLILMTEKSNESYEGIDYFFKLNDSELKTVRNFVVQYGIAFLASISSVIFFKTFMKKHATMKFAVFLTVLSAIVYIFVIVFGTSVGGTRVDVVIAGFSFQPGEILKYFYCIIIGVILGDCDSMSERRVMYASAVTIVFLMFMVIQGEFGTLQVVALAYFMIVVCYMGKNGIVRMCIFVVGLGVAGAVVYFANRFILHIAFITTQFDKIFLRFKVWLNPNYDIFGAGYQMHEAMKKVYLSGWFGQYGSRNTIYAADNDLVFVSIIYAFGMITAIALVVAYILVAVNQFKVVGRAKSSKLKVMAAMASAIIFSQAFFNIGGATGVLPLSGITLPFISRGGSSVVGVSLMMTLVFMLSSNTGKEGLNVEPAGRQKNS